MSQIGSTTVATPIKGFASMVSADNSEFSTLGDKVFPSGILIYNKDTGAIYAADGKTQLSSLPARIDQVLTKAEKTALSNAFGTGSYVAAANGVVVFGADGKIDDVAFKFVDNGKIKQSYLSDFLDESNKIKIEALPDVIRAGWQYFADYDALSEATDEQKKAFCFVADASGDETVDAGWALYVWDTNNSKWIKMAEGEGMDFGPDMFVSYNNVAKVGAVMYDQKIQLGSSLTELAAMLPKVETLDITAEDLSGTQGAQVALGVSFSGDKEDAFDITITPTGCSISGFASEPNDAGDGVPKTFNGTISQVNAEIASAQVTVGESSGTIKIDYADGKSKTINVTKTE